MNRQKLRGAAVLLRRVSVHPVAHNAGALYLVQLASLVLPLLTVPYLARVLRPEGWGVVVFAQSFAIWLSLLLEYGFGLSATRMIARQPDSPQYVAMVVARVQGAKCLLLFAVASVSVVVWWSVPTFHVRPWYLFWAVLGAIAQGFSVTWYYQGIERMKGIALVEVISRVAIVVGIFAFVRQADQGWVVLMLQACAGALAAISTTWWIYRTVPLVRPTLRSSWTMLVETAGLFLFRSASGVYTFANSFILGMFVEARVVAYYGGADKLVRAGISLLGPISQALYPRMSHLAVNDPSRARHLVVISLLLMGTIGALGGISLAVLAPVLVRVLLGAGYDSVVPVLRVLAMLLPIIAIGTVLGVQWALPMGLDRPFYRIVVSAGILNVLFAILLVPSYGALGMAWSVVLTETFVVLGLLVLAMRHHRSETTTGPLGDSADPEATMQITNSTPIAG